MAALLRGNGGKDAAFSQTAYGRIEPRLNL